jgi:hypothetical protein
MVVGQYMENLVIGVAVLRRVEEEIRNVLDTEFAIIPRQTMVEKSAKDPEYSRKRGSVTHINVQVNEFLKTSMLGDVSKNR